MFNGLFEEGLVMAASKVKGFFNYSINHVEFCHGRRIFEVNLLDETQAVVKTIQIIIKDSEVRVNGLDQ